MVSCKQGFSWRKNTETWEGVTDSPHHNETKANRYNNFHEEIRFNTSAISFIFSHYLKIIHSYHYWSPSLTWYDQAETNLFYCYVLQREHTYTWTRKTHFKLWRPWRELASKPSATVTMQRSLQRDSVIISPLPASPPPVHLLLNLVCSLVKVKVHVPYSVVLMVFITFFSPFAISLI